MECCGGLWGYLGRIWVSLGPSGAEGSLCVRRWARGPHCWSWLWLSPAKPSPCWGVHQHPPVLAPRAHPEPPSQAGPPLLLPDFDNILGLPGTATAPPPCPPPAGPHPGEQHPRDPPCVAGAFGDTAGGSGIAPAPLDPATGKRGVPGWLPGDPGTCRGWLPGDAVPAGCGSPEEAAPARRGRAAPRMCGTGTKTDGAAATCPVPVSPGPPMLMSLDRIVPASRWPQLPLFPNSHGPVSLYPDVSAFPDPFVPKSPHSLIPLCPVSRCPHVSPGIAGCCRQGWLPVPGEGSHGGRWAGDTGS